MRADRKAVEDSERQRYQLLPSSFTTSAFWIHVVYQIWTCKEMSRKVSPLSARPGKVVLLVSTDGNWTGR